MTDRVRAAIALRGVQLALDRLHSAVLELRARLHSPASAGHHGDEAAQVGPLESPCDSAHDETAPIAVGTLYDPVEKEHFAMGYDFDHPESQ